MGLCLPLLAAIARSGDRKLQPAFEPPPRVYNYTPCIMEGEYPGTAHIWYCANRTPGDVTDYLCHRKGTRSGSAWKWSDETVALGPGASRADWDSRHVCDPEVISGRYRWKGANFRYAMLYLGCDAELSTHNQVGVAFANSLEGPWTKYPNPIVRYTDDPNGGVVREFNGWPVYRHWGVGQPAAVSLDRRGRLMLFYSRSDTVWGVEMAELDMSDMDRGPVLGKPVRVATDGLRRKDSPNPVGLNNIGVALDEGRDTLYLVREELPPSDSRFPNFISAYTQVASCGWSDLRNGRGRWKVLGEVDEARTGWPRNHNAAFMKDAWGRLNRPDRLTVAVSLAQAFDAAPPDFEWLWTYRIGLVQFPLDAQPKQN